MRRNTQRLYESIMKVVDRSVRKALNEQISQKDMADWADEVGEPYTSDELGQRPSRLHNDMARWAEEAGEMYTSDELDDYDSIFTDETFRYIADNGTLPAKFKINKLNFNKFIDRLSEDICDLKRFIPDIDRLTISDVKTFLMEVNNTSGGDYFKKNLDKINKYEAKYRMLDGFQLMVESVKLLKGCINLLDQEAYAETIGSLCRTVVCSKVAQKLSNIALFAANVYYQTKSKKLCIALSDYLQSQNGFADSLSYNAKSDYQDKNNGIINLPEIVKLKNKNELIGEKRIYIFRYTFDFPAIWMLLYVIHKM